MTKAINPEDFKESFARVSKELSKLHPPPFDARDETTKLHARVKELEELVASLVARITSLEDAKYAENNLIRERRECGYDD